MSDLLQAALDGLIGHVVQEQECPVCAANARTLVQEIAALRARLEEVERERERLLSETYELSALHRDGCGWVHRAEKAEARVQALAAALARLVKAIEMALTGDLIQQMQYDRWVELHTALAAARGEGWR